MINHAQPCARRAYGSLMIAGLFTLMSCGGVHSDGPCNAPVGDFVAYGVQLESASVTWALDKVPPHTAGVVSEGPGIGDCQLVRVPGHLPSPANPTTCQRQNFVSFTLDCVAAAETIKPPITRDYRARWSFSFDLPSDPRTWNTDDAVPPTASMRQQYPAYLWDSASCQAVATGSEHPNLPIVVEEATGGIADYPLVVTSDYRRVFRIDFARTEALGACAGTVSMTMSLRFVQTATDFSVVQMPCYLCK
jgi:hypothetical protein